MKFKPGDKVRVISDLEYWRKIQDANGELSDKFPGYNTYITFEMCALAGKILTIRYINDVNKKTYVCNEILVYWSEWMLESTINKLEIE